MSEVQIFLFKEARYMDEGRYQEWLSLWTMDAVYWVPCNDDDSDPNTHVSIIFDDRERLEQRIERLLSGSVLAVEPRPKMRRVISNIEIVDESASRIIVESNFVLGVARSSGQQFWIGRSRHELRSVGSCLGIVRKKVMLINNDQEIPLLQFLI
jgi:3-phenylpropionate/cinnamic acid dioxygenase small subunit